MFLPHLTDTYSPDCELQVSISEVGDHPPLQRYAKNTEVFKKVIREALAKANLMNESGFRSLLRKSPLLDIPATIEMGNAPSSKHWLLMIASVAVILVIVWFFSKNRWARPVDKVKPVGK